jgi:hypothetical protein
MNNELKRIWKEAVVTAEVPHYPGICLEGLRKITKTTVRIACLRAEV